MVPKDHPLVAHVVELLPIAGLEAWLREEVLAQGELVQFKRRATLFKEGDDDPYAVFLVDGEVELQAGDNTPTALRAGLGDALRALAQLRPRRYTARCQSKVTVFRIRRAVLDHILSDEQVSKEGTSISEAGFEIIDTDEDPGDWMTRLLESELFTRLPPDHMARFFAELDPVMVEPDEVIVEQGMPGEYLYIVAEGQCTVVRKARGSAHEQALAQLTIGDVFGEESLISQAPRNATVRAVTKGMVMRLPKASFEELVSRPVLRPITYSDAEALVESGAQWLDVRFPEEYELDGLAGALNVPLGLLRLELPKMDRNRTYITYCESGGRASTAAFLMMRERLETLYLAGGLQHIPSITDSVTNPGDTPQTGFQCELESAAPTPAVSGPAAEPPTALCTDTRAPAHAGAGPAVAGPKRMALEAEVASLKAELDAAVSQLHDERARHEKALTTARDELSQLRIDRDAQSARANKAVSAARALKQRGEQAVRALAQERAQLTRAKELQATTEAQSKRALEMERLRLNGELETLQVRLDTARVEFEAKTAQAHAAATRQAQGFEQRALKLESDLAQQQATQADLENKAGEDLDRANSKVMVLEAEAASARARIEVLEARFEATRKTIVEQESQLQDVARQAADQQHEDARQLGDQHEQLALARAELDVERRSYTQQQSDTEAAFEEQRRMLEASTAQLVKDQDALERKRQAWTQEHAQQQSNYKRRIEDREATLAEAENALREEESQWQRRVAEAVKDERQKLEAEIGEIEHVVSAFEIERSTTLDELATRESALAADRETLLEAQRQFEELHSTDRAEADALSDTLALREQEHAKARAELEFEQVSQAEQHEQAMKRLLERAHGEMSQLKSAYEKKLAEQAALLADELRRLENQAVRLDEALAQSRPAPDTLVADVGVRQAPEMDSKQTERARVMTPAQLVELRKRMQDKLTALKQS